MNMNEKFKLMARPPQEALNTIQYGKLKGKSDINPQWRIEALTEVFGLCGVGWYYEIISTNFEDVPATGERMVYITIAIHVKQEDGTWSAPVIGIGGDFVVIKDKNGIHGNDEAFQMALTDALGKAAKCVGIASDIYRGKYDSKYGWRDEHEKQIQQAEKNNTTNKYWQVVGKDVQIRTKDGSWKNLDTFELRWLEAMLLDPRFEEVKNFIQMHIDTIKGKK